MAELATDQQTPAARQFLVDAEFPQPIFVGCDAHVRDFGLLSVVAS